MSIKQVLLIEYFDTAENSIITGFYLYFSGSESLDSISYFPVCFAKIINGNLQKDIELRSAFVQ